MLQPHATLALSRSFLFASLACLAVCPLSRAQVLYVAVPGSSGINSYSTDTGAFLRSYDSVQVQGVTTDPNGNVYALNDPSGSGSVAVTKFDGQGNSVSAFGTNGAVTITTTGSRESLAINPTGTEVLVVNRIFSGPAATVSSISSTTGAATSGFTTINVPNALSAAYDTSGANLYVGTSTGVINRYSSTGEFGAQIELINSSFGNVFSIHFLSDTQFLSTTGHQINRYNLADNIATLDPTFGTGGSVSIVNAYGLAVDDTGKIYVSSYSGINGYIEQLSPDGAVLNAAFVSGLTNPTQLAFSAIPEPSTYAAFAGLGALALAAWRRRRLRSQDVRDERTPASLRRQ